MQSNKLDEESSHGDPVPSGSAGTEAGKKEPAASPQQGPPQLPQTGFPVRQVLSAAILLVAFGAGAIILTPRRRSGMSRK